VGKHYVPQKYLKGFADTAEPQKIWMYDKKLGSFTHPTIKSAAQERDFYDSKTEIRLNEQIERPANVIIDKLRNRQQIEERERLVLAIYIGTTIMRVPRRRSRALSILPKAIDRVLQEVADGLLARNKDDPTVRTLTDEDIKAIRTSLIADPPAGAIEAIREPWASENVIQHVYNMQWRIVASAGPSFFLTSDNPASHFEAIGIGRPQSELVFPIATDLALIANWQQPLARILFGSAEQKIVKEVNRRIVHGAERFVFSSRREDWIARVANKAEPRFNRIIWRD
jgi:hypothetical protein